MPASTQQKRRARATRNIILLDPKDNVVVACRNLPAGSRFNVRLRSIAVTASVVRGFKVAATAISEGDTIVKHGAPIGSATRDIAAGERVHVDNMKSDYIPTYTLDSTRDVAG